MKLLKQAENTAFYLHFVRNSWYQVGCSCQAECGWPSFIVRWVLCGSSGPAILLSKKLHIVKIHYRFQFILELSGPAQCDSSVGQSAEGPGGFA